MATVALGDSRVITGCVPDSQRRRDIDDSVDQTDRLQAKHIKALLELKLFDLGWLMPRTWLQGSVIFAQALIKTCPDECKTPGSRRGGGASGVNVSPQWPDKGSPITRCRVKVSALAKARRPGRQSAARDQKRLHPSVPPNEDRISQDGASDRWGPNPGGPSVTCCRASAFALQRGRVDATAQQTHVNSWESLPPLLRLLCAAALLR